MALHEQQRNAITADVWEIVRERIRSAPPLCLKRNPLVKQVIYQTWQLVRMHLRGSGLAGPHGIERFHLTMSLLLIGLLDGTLCGCHHCESYNFTELPGKVY